MADPLSIAASIAGVVTLADLVFGRLYKYAKAVKDVPAEVKQLTTLVNDLGGLLNSLARLARALEGERFDVSLRMQHVDACNSVLASLDKLLQKAEKDLAKPGQLDRIQRKLKWPFSTSQIKEYLAELSTHKDSIVLALSADTMNGLLQSLSFERKLLDATDEIIQDVRETRKITTRIEESSERTKVLKAFLKHNPQENYDMSLSLRHPRTGLWLLRLPAFQTWLDTPGSKLWLSGIPGAGKTVLAASVIEAALARSSDKVAVAFYFCDYKTETTWNPCTILGVIAAQLALQSEEAYGELASFYDQLHPPNGLPRSPRILELTMALSTMTDKFDQVFLIVDALDECGEHTTSVVETLASYANDHDNVCAALLSRDEDEIRFRLGDDFENLEIAAHSEDVAEYVSSEIQERVRTGRLRVGDNDLLADIQRTLVDKAHGMFRWVTCQLDHLGECHSDRSRRAALDSLPPDLEETYVRLLHRIKPSQESLVSMALNFIGYLSGLLPIPELQHALSVRPDQESMSPQDVVYEEAISRACSSMIRKTNDGKHFEFAHFSVREFLESERLSQLVLGHFRISRLRCSGMFATQCLRYLQLDSFKHDIASTAFNYRPAFPLYHVASLHWLKHARAEWTCNDDVRGLAELLFDRRKAPSFIRWAAYLLPRLHNSLLLDLSGNALPPQDRVRKWDFQMVVLDSRFTPLHIAAMLGLPEICQKLISEGVDLNLQSPLGSPIWCAVLGINALNLDSDARSASPWIRSIHGEDEQSTPHDISRTVKCIMDAQKFDSPSYNPIDTSTLMKNAIITCGLIADFSMIATLIRNGVEPEDSDRVLFKEDTRISMDDEALKELGFAGAVGGDINKLNIYLNDPRTSADSVAREMMGPDNNTLLHCALEASPTGHREFGSRLAVTRRLLEVGCSPASVNDKGQTPLHIWNWGDDAGGTQRQELEDLIRSLLEKGASILLKDTEGANALHWWASIGLAHTMRAVLNVVSLDEAEKALAMTDDKGMTPLMDAIENNHAEVVNLLLQYRSYQSHDFEMLDKSKLLSLAGGIQSAPLLRSLIAVGFPITSDDRDSALHHVKETTSAECIKTLKGHLPGHCIKRASGRLPVEVYLQQWFSKPSAENHPHITNDQDQHFKTIEQLTNHDTLTARDESGLSVWGFTVTFVRQSKQPFSPQRRSTICSGLGYILQLGYMRSHEISSKESGIVPLLESLDLPARQSIDFWLVSPQFLMDVINATEYWPQFRVSPMALELLRSFYTPTFDTAFIRFLLEREVFPGGRDPYAALRLTDLLITTGPASEAWREAVRLTIDRVANEDWNKFDPLDDGVGAIHCTRSVWLIEEIIRRGADPNLRASPSQGNIPALVWHILGSRPEIALCLLKNGARADEADANGLNAMHAAVIAGNVNILESILACLGFSENSPWYSLCEYRWSGRHRTVNVLHLSALKGQLACMEFLLRHDEAQKLRNESDRTWQTMDLAAMGGHDGTIRYLHKQGFDINCRNPYNGYTPLHTAVTENKPSAVQTLMELGAASVEDKEGLTPLALALLAGLPEIIEMLDHTLSTEHTEQGPSLEFLPPLASWGQRLMPTIEMAIQRGNIGLCKRLRKLGCPLEGHLLCGGCSLLVLALSCGRGPIASWLIEEGASVVTNGCLKHGNASALELCVKCETLDIKSTERFLAKYVQEGGDIVDAEILSSAVKANAPGNLRVLLKAMKAALTSRKGKPDCTVSTSNAKWDLEGIEMLVDAYYDTDTEEPEIQAILADDIANALPVGEPCYPSAICPLFSDGWETRLSSIKFSSTSMWKSIDSNGETPIITACRYSSLKALLFLVSKGADYQRTNIAGRSVLHIAAVEEFTEKFCYFLQLGVDPHLPSVSGTSAVHIAMTWQKFTATLVNCDLGLSNTGPIPWADFAKENEAYPLFLLDNFRLYQRKLRHLDLLRIANLQPSTCWSPLCLMTLETDIKAMGRILDLGAVIDHEGSPEGSALILACTAGALSPTRFLVRRGASLCYSTPDGHRRSALAAAEASSSITKWLLVERFIEQPKICPLAATERGEEAFKPWSGGGQVEFLIKGKNERDPRESSFDYYKRLMKIRRYMRGKVVPPSDRGKTRRPSKLNPVETVRLHPEDMRSPRE
ncbi:hypothetical protein PG984_002902 [Apiospora sp. TS-2023a]